MLILSRRVGEIITIDDDVEIVFIRFQGNGVRIGIKAPKTTRIGRKDAKSGTQEQQGQTAQGEGTPV